MSSSHKRARDRSPGDATRREKSPRRVATVYDAVAGRIGYESFLGEDAASANRDTKSSTNESVYPEEVLFRRKGAPQRFEENDPYFANERLDPKSQRLPDSDLLKAIHSYASDFYSRAVPVQGKWDWRSMDETALLAMGILLEESIAAKIGQTGDLAFVEGADADEGIKGPALWDGKRYRRSVLQRGSTAQRHQQGQSSGRQRSTSHEG